MSSVIMNTRDVKKALDFLILEKTRAAKKLASGIRKLTNSRGKLNGEIRMPTGMFRDINEIIPAVVYEVKNEGRF